MSAILVTGTTGLLGHHTARALNQQGRAAARLRTVGQRPNERHWPCRPDSCDRGAPSFHHGPARSGAAPANPLSGWLAARGCGRRSASDSGTAAGTARSLRPSLPAVGHILTADEFVAVAAPGGSGPGLRQPTPLVVAVLRLLDRLRGTGPQSIVAKAPIVDRELCRRVA